jgi:hypothetical protein
MVASNILSDQTFATLKGYKVLKPMKEIPPCRNRFSNH